MENEHKNQPNFDQRFKPLAESITNKSSAEGALDWVTTRCRDAGLPKEDAERIVSKNYS